MRKFIWILMALILAISVSCDGTGPENDLVEVCLAVSSEKSLEVVSNGEIVEYRYESIPLFESKHLIGATGGFVRLGTDVSSAFPIGYLSQGKWIFNVQGLNDEGIVIATGSTERYLEKGMTQTIPITVTTDRTIGTGGVAFTFDSDATSASNMSFIVRYRSIDSGTWTVKNSGFTRTMRESDSEVTFSGRIDGLASGHWELHFILVDNGVYIGGESVTIQIVAGRTSTVSGIILPSKHIALEMSITSPGYVNGVLENNLPENPEVARIHRDESVTLSWANESDATVIPDSWVWMVDGEIKDVPSSSSSYTYYGDSSPGYGEHQISVIALHHVGGRELEIGSASAKIEVVRRLATITFDAGSGYFPDGTSSQTITQDTYDDPKVPKIPERTGYVFAGWMYGSELAVTAANVVIPAAYRCEGTRTLTAAWVQSVYSLTLVYGGGGIRKVYGSVSGGSQRELPAQETKTDIAFGAGLASYIETPLTRYGYVFRGWYTEENGRGTQIYGNSWSISNYGWTHDITLYAWWTLEEYTVTYRNAIYFGTYSTSSEAFAADSEEGVTKLRNNPQHIAVSKNQVIYYEYTLTDTGETGRLYLYVTTGCTTSTQPEAKAMARISPAGSDKQNQVAIDCPYGAMPEPKIQGLKFLGWFTSPVGGYEKHGTDIFEANNVAANNENLYAHWEEGNIHVTTTDGHGTTLRSGTAALGSIYGSLIPANPTWTGYTFQGWYIDDTMDMVVAGSIVSRETDHTVNARWLGNLYTVTFIPVSGGAALSQKTVQFGSTYGDLPTPERTGYDFSGWWLADGSAQKREDSPVTTVGDHNLVGHWNEKTIEVTLNAGEGQMYVLSSNVSSITLTGRYDDPYSSLKSGGNTVGLPTPTWYGHTFQGWYTDPSGGVKIDGGNTITSTTNLTLYARYSSVSVTLDFWKNDGSGERVEQRSRLFGSAYGSLPSVSRQGYTFLGWFTAPSGTDIDQVDENTTVTTTSTINLYAWWVLRNVAVTLDPGGGTIDGLSTKVVYVNWGNAYSTAKYNGSTEGLHNAVKTGYSFTDWQRQTDSTIVTNSTTMGLETDHVLVAQYDPISVDVTLDPNGGSLLESLSPTTLAGVFDQEYSQLKSGDTPVGLPSPTKEGYEFAGWYTSLAFNTSPIQPGTTITNPSAHTLYAKWVGRQIRVTYEWGDSSTSRLLEYGADVYGPFPTPTKSGYSIEGWYRENTYQTRVEPVTVMNINSDHTIYANWQQIKYKYTLDTDDLEDTYWSGDEVKSIINQMGPVYNALSKGSSFGSVTYDYLRKVDSAGSQKIYSGETTGTSWTQDITQNLNFHLVGQRQKWKRTVACTGPGGTAGGEYEACGHCNSLGTDHVGQIWNQCNTCNGSGRIEDYDWVPTNSSTSTVYIHTNTQTPPEDIGFDPFDPPTAAGQHHTTIEYEQTGEYVDYGPHGREVILIFLKTTTQYTSVRSDFPCSDCQGTGGHYNDCHWCEDGYAWDECDQCHGSGYVTENQTTTSTITVNVNGTVRLTGTYNNGATVNSTISIPYDSTVSITVTPNPSSISGWSKNGDPEGEIAWEVYDPTYTGKVTLLKQNGTALNLDPYLTGYTKGQGSGTVYPIYLVSGNKTVSNTSDSDGNYTGNLTRYYLYPGYLWQETYAGNTLEENSKIQATYGGTPVAGSPRTVQKGNGSVQTPTLLSWSSTDLQITTSSGQITWGSSEYITGFHLEAMQ